MDFDPGKSKIMDSRALICLAILLACPGTAELACPQDLAAESAPTPVDPRADSAAARALEYLKSAQKDSGAWTFGDGREATSITSLSVMAYLACGHVPGEPGPYRETIEKGIRYVVSHQQPNGLLVSNSINGPMYCHGISTLMLAEVAGMTTDPALSSEVRESLSKGVDVILRAQAINKNDNNAGGWRYQPDSRDSDISVTGWQVMALRASKDAGCTVPTEAIDRAVEYLRRCASKDGGFGYQPGGGANNPRTGTGTLALEICGAHLSPEAVSGAEYLTQKDNAPRWSSQYFFYEVYYAPQALFQVGDKYFQAYYPKLVEILLDHQEKDGSWLSGDGNDRTAGRSYCTAMGVLALAVEYRYLPIYQR